MRSGTIVCNSNLEPVLSLAGIFQNKMPGQPPTKGTFTALVQEIGTAGLQTGGDIRSADHNPIQDIWILDTNGGIPTLSPWETVGAVHIYQNPCIAAPQ